ncbi:MAG: ATP synthase F1 subunit epsilon [Oscillospiraceae bacterium]|nr:ATP synthase F1 subunit epsilon [Oscillospiraceae bacterium]
MSTFHLKIVSPDGVFFDGEAKQLSIRSIDGEIAVLKGHIPFLTAVAVGECRLYVNDGEVPKTAACCGGMLNVSDEEVLLAPTTFEWADDIDIERAEAAMSRAEALLQSASTDADRKIAKRKLERANLRIKVAKKA